MKSRINSIIGDRLSFLVVMVWLIMGIMVVQAGVPTNVPEVRGCIKIKDSYETVPSFRILFDGKKTINNREGFYSVLLDDKEEGKFFLLVCKAIKQVFDKSNTIKNLSIAKDATYRFFSFQKDFWTSRWEVQETRLDDRAIPAHCLVVLLDPEYIDHVESWNAQLPAQVIKAPTIVLKNSVSRTELNQAAAQSLLSALEVTPFHEPVQERVKNAENNLKVSVALPQ
jgi:hypothetical protein